MEYEPREPFNPYKRPEATGSEEVSKKKKKRTTRIPLTKYVDPEQSSNQDEPKPDNVLEKLFEKSENPNIDDSDKIENEAEEYSEDYNESELAELSGAIDESEHEQTELQSNSSTNFDFLSDNDTPSREVQNGIEGEFVDEMPLVISRAEEPESEIYPNTEKEEEYVNLVPPELETPHSPAEIVEEPLQPVAEEHETVINEINHRQTGQNSQISPVNNRAEITQADVDESVYRAEKRGVRKGVVAGGLVGWWIGRRGKKETLKQAESEVKKRDKKIEQLEYEQNVSKDRIATITRIQESLEQVVASNGREMSSPAFGSEAKIDTSEKKLNTEEANKKTEPNPENQEITEDMYKTAKDRRIETSAWHSIEVDNKTGRAVTNPERAYGKEFANEQRQEKLRSQHSDPGLAAHFGHATLQSVDNLEDTKLKGNSQAKNNSKRSLKTNVNYIKNQVVNHTTNPVTWVIAVTIVIILVFVGVLN